MNDEQFEQDVRSALDPSSDVVRLVVQRALTPKTRARLRPALWATAAILLLTAAVLLHRPERAREDVQLRLTNVGDTIVMQPGAGEVWLIGVSQDHDRLPPGTVIVHSPGEPR